MSDTYTCGTCGAVVEFDWQGEHDEYHQAYADLVIEVREMRDSLRRALVGDQPEVGFRGPAYDEPI